MPRPNSPLQYVQIEPSLGRHPKVKKLARKLSISEWMAHNHWVTVLEWAGEQHVYGCLDGADEEEIAIEAHWEGEPSIFVKSLLDVKLLVKDGDSLYINGWMEMYEYPLNRRKDRHSTKDSGGTTKKNGGPPEKVVDHPRIGEERIGEERIGAPLLESETGGSELVVSGLESGDGGIEVVVGG